MTGSLALLTTAVVLIASGLKGVTIPELLSGKGSKLGPKGPSLNEIPFDIGGNVATEGPLGITSPLGSMVPNTAGKGRWKASDFKGPNPQLLAFLANAAETQYHLTITSTHTGNHVGGSFHYLWRALDASGSAANMLAFAKYVTGFAPTVNEMFHTPLGYSIDNGKRTTYLQPGHDDHVHVAV